jgi:hypothetical protein
MSSGKDGCESYNMRQYSLALRSQKSFLLNMGLFKFLNTENASEAENPFNPYNPISNIKDDENAYCSGDHETHAQYHLKKASISLHKIKQKDAALANLLEDWMRHSLLALNAYHHDIFERSHVMDSNEDMMTRLRKNR